MHVQAPTAALLAQILRREQLAELELNADGLVRTPPHYLDIAGPDLLDVARTHSLEGVIAMRTTSLYYPGKRSPAWIETPLRNTQEVIIGGWTEGGGRRSGTLGALLLGMHDISDGRLRYVGRVGTGFTRATLRKLQAVLEARARPTSPFDEPVPREDVRDAHWVTPNLVGEVEYRQWTPTDNRLRHPSWRGLRHDKPTRDHRVLLQVAAPRRILAPPATFGAKASGLD